MVRHLAAPAVALVPFTLVGAGAAVLFDALATDGDRVAAAVPVSILLAIAAVYAGASGAAISIVRDAPDPMSSTNQEVYLPPEMAGFTTVIRTIIPLVISAAGAVMALGVRSALDNGTSDPLANAVRGCVAIVLLTIVAAVWVKYRDRARRKIRAFMAEGRDYTQQQRSAR
jgi:hypothetical protein